MDWRLAISLNKLRDQVNTMFPKRSKASDGTVGDAAHATRSSDHNPWVQDHNGQPIVTALDITHDPNSGFDSYKFAEYLLSKKDPRIKYIISNRKIAAGNPGPKPWAWRSYTGKNPHDHHIHISVIADESLYDSTKAWDLSGFAVKPDPNYVPPPPTLKRGSTGEHVVKVQQKLMIPTHGTFDDNTYYAVKGFQVGKGLLADGIVGPQTWKLIK